VLDLAILGLLKEQDLHGYELKKRLSETLGVASGVSFGSLYPALGRLERSGAVRTVALPAALPDEDAVAVGARPVDASPHAGSLGGEFAAWRARAAAALASGAARPASASTRSGRSGARTGRSRKVYGITPAGEAMFDELLAAEQSSGDDSRLFHLRLAFARYLTADARLRMLERRRTQLVERLSRVSAGGRTGRRVDGYVRSLMEHDREITEHDLSWIDRLIATERGARSDPARPASSDGPEPLPRTHLRSAIDPRPGTDPTAPGPSSGPVTPDGADRRAVAARRRTVSPPTLSGFRPDPTARAGQTALRHQEESTR
jgi:DNA-binding PadR family transcriptional regulator